MTNVGKINFFYSLFQISIATKTMKASVTLQDDIRGKWLYMKRTSSDYVTV